MSTCEACREYEQGQRKETLTSHETPSRPWEFIAADQENSVEVQQDWFRRVSCFTGYRNTKSASIQISPALRLFSRGTRSLQPMTAALLQPSVSDEDVTHTKLHTANNNKPSAITPGIVNRTFENRTQSNSIDGLSSIEFGNRTKSNTTLSVSSISEQIEFNRINRTQSNSIRLIVFD